MPTQAWHHGLEMPSAEPQPQPAALAEVLAALRTRSPSALPTTAVPLAFRCSKAAQSSWCPRHTVSSPAGIAGGSP